MKKLLTIVAAIAMLSFMMPGQSATADIYGTVVLPDGSAIPGVAVTLTGNVIGKMVQVTSEEGNFRFLSLPPGNYELKFELEGFKTVVQKGIRLFLGKNKTFNVQMETTKLKEVVEVKGQASAVDTRKTTVSVNVSKEMMQSLPTARNPWTVMNLVPGMMLDREDVGGAESGQQSNFFGHGASSDDTTWNVDGANITDPSAIGAAPAYLNVNSYEELQITLGNNDISAQTGGVQLNFVSKRAGNRYSGDFHLYVEDKAWEMSQTLPAYYATKGWEARGVNRMYQYGVNFGGPVVKDKVWFFGSWAIQDIHARTLVGDEDSTWLVSGYLKTNFQSGNTSGDVQMSYDAKKKWGRTVLSRAQQDAGSLLDQDGPGYVYLGSLQQVMGNLMLTAKVAYTNGGFILDPRGSDINSDNINAGAEWQYRYIPTEYYGSLYHYITDRNTLDLSLNGNYFAEGVLGGDHEIRFGVDYYTATTTTNTLYPNERIAFFYGSAYGSPGDPYYSYGAWLIPNSFYNADFQRMSFYLSDTATFGKLTANIGLRYDKETGTLNEQLQQGFTWYEPGSPHNGEKLFNNILGDLLVQGGKSPQSYTVFSPRVSLTYDINGDGKNVVKLSVARYGSQSGNALTNRYWPYREADLAWKDLNNDQMINYNEIASYYYWTNTDEINYTTGWKKNQTDSNFNSPLLDELTLSFEKALADDITVTLVGFYKKNHNLVNTIGILSNGQNELEGNNWFYAGDFTFTDGSTTPYYYRNEKPSLTYYTNYDSKTYYRYMALQFMFSKKFSNKWMFDASFTYADWKAFYNKADYGDGDLTNYDYFNNATRAPAVSGSSGLSGIYVNARWQVKFSGLYQLPWGINITGVFNAREGYVLPYHESLRRGGPAYIGWTNMYKPGEKFGDNRLPSFWMLSLGLEKTFKVSDTVSTTLFVDGYNITNNKTTLLVETDYTAQNFNQPLRILSPGIFQFGVRVNF